MPISLPSDSLPHVDEHSATVDAGAEATWNASLRVIEVWLSSASRTARLLGCTDTTSSGPRPLATGSVLPGFRVEAAEPGRLLALAGKHRFSNYALILRFEGENEGATRIRAETRATFPGVTGSVYRALVIGTRGHILVTRRLLAGIKRRAERR
ncbi:MAG TPA: hypothetical protein VFT10_06625 [Solirubrobacterales bacterium]|nr:hypothetical protein [Solirubrobacterales bacterium]